MTMLDSLPAGFQVMEFPPDQSQPRQSFSNGNGGGNKPPAEKQAALPEGCDEDGAFELLGGMITQALTDLLSPTPEVRQDALDWFLSQDNRNPRQCGRITFRWTCEVNSVHSGYLLRKLREAALEKARSKCLKSRTSLDEYLRRLDPFLHPANGGGQ